MASAANIMSLLESLSEIAAPKAGNCFDPEELAAAAQMEVRLQAWRHALGTSWNLSRKVPHVP